MVDPTERWSYPGGYGYRVRGAEDAECGGGPAAAARRAGRT